MIDLATEADKTTTAGLERLSAGARRWIIDNLSYFEPSHPALPDTPRVKASLELALLCLIWTRLHPGDEQLARVAATVRDIWQDPGFPRRLAASPQHFRIHGLNFIALAPAGLADGYHRVLREKLAPGGRFPRYGKVPHVRLEARYYADLAGLVHDCAPYRQLYEESLLAGWTTTLPVGINDAYAITHILFHLTDFGARDAGLADGERERLLRVVDELIAHFLGVGHWDLLAELMMSQRVLGGDPTRTASGMAVVHQLLQAQTPSGAIPGWCAAQRVPESAPQIEVFRKAYHPTLVTAIASMLVLSSSRGR